MRRNGRLNLLRTDAHSRPVKSPMLHHRKVPTVEAYLAFSAKSRELMEVTGALARDFRRGLTEMMEKKDDYEARALVRAFGSLIEGLAAMMRELACGLCELFGEPLNPFLRDKANDRNTSTVHRIYTTYRLLAEFMPDSPLAHIPDSRWDDLHKAVAIRNRVVHPTCLADIELNTEDVNVVARTGIEFVKDLPGFIHWCGQEKQKFVWGLGGQRVRQGAKLGRNDPCPCGSKKKYKACCGAAG